jgi:hypothetical protein
MSDLAAWDRMSDADKAACLCADVQELTRRVGELRTFEREYRSRLRAYHSERIRELEGKADGGPCVVHATTTWTDVPGTGTRVRLVSVSDTTTAWVEVDTR